MLDRVQGDLRRLQDLLSQAVSTSPTATAVPAPAAAAPTASLPAGQPSAPQSGGPTPPVAESGRRQQAEAVNTALQQADAHAAALRDLPEWQKLQTVRGAFGNLVRVMTERAGQHFDRLTSDHRVGSFLRQVGQRTCEKIAEWAQAGAGRLRQDKESNAAGKDPASADALRRLRDTATAYASPGRAGPPPSSGNTVDIPEMRKLGEALSRPLPGAKPRVSAAAARGKSTTRRGTKKPSTAAEQPSHLRCGDTEQQGPKPTQR